MTLFPTRCGLVIFCLLIWRPAFGESLQVLAQPAPWPVADHLIVYKGRVWFSTSVKGVDHNSADIWSLDPATGDTRFERYLFSQDAGDPVVHKGLLYWPQEDMRIGIGAGAVSVTDGQNWRDLFVPVPDHMMHTHATTEWRGKLVAAMAGWNGAIAVSDDAGDSWSVIANDAPKTGSFHRYNDVVSAGGRLFIKHWENTGTSLAEYRDGSVVSLEDWPSGRTIHSMAAHGDALFVVADNEAGDQVLWRVDDAGVRALQMLPADLTPQLVISDGQSLWIVAREGDGGRLWSSPNGYNFQPGDTFKGGTPYSAVALSPGTIYVSGEGHDGMAIVWGPKHVDLMPSPVSDALVPKRLSATDPDFDTESAYLSIKDSLASPNAYQNHARSLRSEINAVLQSNPPSEFFTSLLSAAVPDIDIDIFGGRATAAASDMAKWFILGAMARQGIGTVPVQILSTSWRRSENRPQKWFAPLLIGLYAVQVSGQNDRATIETLINRLREADDPPWLSSQVTGSLSSITGQSFAYDIGGLIDWWDRSRQDWPELSH